MCKHLQNCADLMTKIDDSDHKFHPQSGNFANV